MLSETLLKRGDGGCASVRRW